MRYTIPEIKGSVTRLQRPNNWIQQSKNGSRGVKNGPRVLKHCTRGWAWAGSKRGPGRVPFGPIELGQFVLEPLGALDEERGWGQVSGRAARHYPTVSLICTLLLQRLLDGMKTVPKVKRGLFFWHSVNRRLVGIDTEATKSFAHGL